MSLEVHFDEAYADWNVGDIVVWNEDKDGPRIQITRIDREHGYIYWNQSETERDYYDGFVLAQEAMTRMTNMLRVQEVQE